MDEVAARLRGQFVGFGDPRRRVEERRAFVARELVDTRERLVAEPALGNIDDAFKGEVVGRRLDEAQISERVADLGAFIEAVAADDAIGHPDRDEAVFEFARLKLRAEDRKSKRLNYSH